MKENQSSEHLFCNSLIKLKVLAVIALLALMTSSAWAGLTLCNQTKYRIASAVAWFPEDPPGVSTGGHQSGVVHGWTMLSAGECKGVDDNSGKSGQFYWYAESQPKGSNKWEGTSRLCVRNDKFHNQQLFLLKGENCKGEWYDVRFRRIDTNATHYKLDITM